MENRNHRFFRQAEEPAAWNELEDVYKRQVKSLIGLQLDCLHPRMPVAGCNAVSGYSGKAVKPIALRFVCEMCIRDRPWPSSPKSC